MEKNINFSKNLKYCKKNILMVKWLKFLEKKCIKVLKGIIIQTKKMVLKVPMIQKIFKKKLFKIFSRKITLAMKFFHIILYNSIKKQNIII